MREIRPLWKFWDDDKGGYFSCPDCPIGKSECASYSICACREEDRSDTSGVGWQCEHLKPNGSRVFCGEMPEESCDEVDGSPQD